MKIAFTGGGTGGHFYPLIAVARALKKIAETEHIAKLELFFMSDNAYETGVLSRENIKFINVPAGKARRYFSLQYLPDTLKAAAGLFWAFWRLYFLLPDVIFSKGGYASFPVLFWARFLKIPVLIHESDSVPGMANKWAGKWAESIALAFPEAARYFEGKNIAIVGNPVRPQIVGGNLDEAVDYFKLEEGVQNLLILGGSQGSERINEIILAILPEALKKYHVIHQTGKNNFKDISGRARVLLGKSEFANRYHPFPFLEEGEIRNAAKAASLIVSRAGAGSIFEIAAWGLPAILIPLLESAQNHQRENAYGYARTGAAEVIEEPNLAPHLLLAEIEKILGNAERIQKMKQAAQTFSRLDAAERIAKELIKLGAHE